MIQLALPFLTKSLVDIGIRGNDLNFVHVSRAGRLLITLGQTSVELLRGWILLHITARLNVQPLTMSQYQQVGSTFINQAKNVFILLVATRLVMRQQMSMGDMIGEDGKDLSGGQRQRVSIARMVSKNPD